MEYINSCARVSRWENIKYIMTGYGYKFYWTDERFF